MYKQNEVMNSDLQNRPSQRYSNPEFTSDDGRLIR